MAVGLDVSALSTYTDQISGALAKQILLSSNTIKGNIVSVQYGAIGNAIQLNSISSTILGKAAACGVFSTSGSTVIGAQVVSMCQIKFEDAVCIDTLNKYYLSFLAEKKFNAETLGSFEDIFVTNKVEATTKVIDQMVWRSASSSPAYVGSLTGNLALCDGFLQKAYSLSASTVNVTKTAMTVANAAVVVDTILASVAANASVLLEDFNLYLSPADFQSYLASLRNLNLFNYGTQAEAVNEIVHPGSIGMHVIKTNGLDGVASGTAIATKKENITLVISDESDLNMDMWFDKPTDELHTRTKIRIGTGFHFPELVVKIA